MSTARSGKRSVKHLPLLARGCTKVLAEVGSRVTHMGVVMKRTNSLLGAAGLVCGTLISLQSMAQTDPVPGHPRENEVNQRLDNQQARINQGLANGTMTGRQAARDEKHDENIAQREAVDESKHDGHITKGEQKRLNKSENRNSHRIYKQKHS
jgi:hypothetical protein